MTQASQGDTVRIHYTGTLNDGSQFDSSAGRDPLEFTIGSGEIIPGLDREIAGMSIGERKSVTVVADQAYGAHDPARTQAVDRAQIPETIPLEIGTRLQMQTPQGETLVVSVAQVTESEVTLDANHPLAGQDLTFDVELVEIV